MFGMGPWELLLVVFPILLTLLIIALVNRSKPLSSDQVPKNRVGGWLILLVMLLVFNALLSAVYLLMTLAENDFLGGLIHLFSIGLTIWLFIEMGKRSIVFPKGIMFFWLFNVIVGLTTAILTDAIPRELVISVIWACIWIPYMKYSRRVAKTFGIESTPESGNAQPSDL